MANYPYIIAGLPDFKPDFEPGRFDYEELSSFIKSQCPESDARLIEWLEAGMDGKHASSTFYNAVARGRNRFLKEFFAFDRKVREAKVAFLDKTTFNAEGFEEDYAALQSIFSTSNIIEREKLLDNLYWEKSSTLTRNDLFNVNTVLAFLVKANIVRRWNALDPAEGAALFSRLVDEVRGTFSGVKYDPNTK